MIKKILILGFIFLTAIAIAQDVPNIEGEYKIDTLINESQEFPGVFDTIIVYKKIKVVHKELVVIDTNFSPIVNRWKVGIEGAYAQSTSSSSLDYLESSTLSLAGIDASVTAYRKKLGLSFLMGMRQKSIKQKFLLETSELNTSKQTAIDTVDTYFIVNSDGSQTPVYVTKENQIEHTDTIYHSNLNSNTHRIRYATIGLSMGYGIGVKKWEFSGLINYKLGVLVSAKGKYFSSGTENEIQLNTLSTFQHMGGLALRVAYNIYPKTDVYLNGFYEAELSSAYRNQGLKHTIIGINLGLLVAI